MNPVVLYFVLLKATLTTFSGLASLPLLRDELVISRAVLTDQQLNTAVVATRTTPGPVGIYVVSVGYFVAGIPDAVAGWLAMCTPALLIIPLMLFTSGLSQSNDYHERCVSSICPSQRNRSSCQNNNGVI